MKKEIAGLGAFAMVEKNFLEIYDKFKLKFYRSVFELVRERDGSLSAMEAFSLEVINMLSEPTVGQFADFLNISQSNATYKVNNLIKKGYLERQNSQTDRREYPRTGQGQRSRRDCLSRRQLLLAFQKGRRHGSRPETCRGRLHGVCPPLPSRRHKIFPFR